MKRYNIDSICSGIFVVADWIAGEPKLMEPTKNEGWQWLEYDKVAEMSRFGCGWLPRELFVGYRRKILKLPADHVD